MNFFIFGDVHGESDKLARILDQARSQTDGPVEIWSLGDLIDRGPDSKGVLDLCLENRVNLVIGNHELWMHELLTRGSVKSGFVTSKVMGGSSTITSYGCDPRNFKPSELLEKIPDSHKEFLKSGVLLNGLSHGGINYWLSHGGIDSVSGGMLGPEIPGHLTGDGFSEALYSLIFEVSPQSILWGGARKGNVYGLPEGNVQVFGHTPWGKAEISERYVALDTGCGTCAPHKLSGMILRSDGSRALVSV